MSGVTTDYRFAPIPEQLLFDPNIDTTAKCVYAVLLRHGMSPDDCYPSHRRIGELLGLSARSVQRPLRALEEAGWVLRTERFDDRGDRISDGFHVRTSPASGALEDAPPAQGSAHPPAQESAHPPRTSARTGERKPLNESHLERDVVQQELDDTPTSTAPARLSPKDALDHLPKKVDPEAVKALCRHLHRRVTDHHPKRRAPTVTAQWVKDMGTLLNSGPLDAEGYVPSADEVRAMIDAVFDRLAERNGARRFCWADQVNSPGALRRSWVKMERELTAGGHSTREEQLAAMEKLDELLGPRW